MISKSLVRAAQAGPGWGRGRNAELSLGQQPPGSREPASPTDQRGASHSRTAQDGPGIETTLDVGAVSQVDHYILL